jgi:hypothetical protein
MTLCSPAKISDVSEEINESVFEAGEYAKKKKTDKKLATSRAIQLHGGTAKIRYQETSSENKAEE